MSIAILIALQFNTLITVNIENNMSPKFVYSKDQPNILINYRLSQ